MLRHNFLAKSHFRSIPKESPWIFYRPEKLSDGRTEYHQLKGRSLLQGLQRIGSRLKMKPFIIHDFRRTAAVNLLEAGVDLKTVADIGGWSDMRTLCERYLPLSQQHIQSAVQKVDTRVDTPPIIKE